MPVSTKKNPAPKWHLIYYLLAAFDLVTISGSLFLNHEIMKVYSNSVDVNMEWAGIQGHFIDLGRIASAVNAPGNDVFDSGEVDAELARRTQALAGFETHMSVLRADVLEKVSKTEAKPLLDSVEEIETAMSAMISESDLIFSYFRENRTEEAGRRMATMDRKYANVIESVANASSFVRGLQSKYFDEQIAVATSLRRFEYLIGGFIAVMVCAVAVYGHMIGKKVKQAQVEALNTRLGRIVEDSINEVYVFEADTLQFLQVNRGARENLGYSMEQLQALTPLDLETDSTPQTFENRLKLLREGAHEQIVYETVHKRNDGSTYDVEIQLQLTRAEAPPVFVAIVQDITEIRAQQEQLRQSQKMDALGQLTGGVTHDFNNLLTVITGNLEVLEARVRENDQRQLISEAKEATKLGADLTRRLLAFARRQPLNPKIIDLNEQLMGMSDWLHRTLGEEIQIKTVLADDLDKTLVDPSQVENAVLNLAINARDAMANGGKLTIETANVELDREYTAIQADVSPGNYVVLSLSDTGSGIPQEIQDHIFEPFFTTKEEKAGAGLGMSMVYGFAKQSGGHITIQSELGFGTTVDLYLPSARHIDEVAAASDTPAKILKASGETVLVVEDNQRVRRVTVRRLTDLGYIVLEAEDGEAALEVLQGEQNIDLLFSDLLMPGITGGELAREALRLRPEIKILLTSGYPGDVAIRKGWLDEGAPLLMKPYSKTELIENIRGALDA
jgi:PAS domain S-box-containing protein